MDRVLLWNLERFQLRHLNMFVPFVNLQFIPRNLELSLIDYYQNPKRFLPEIWRDTFLVERVSFSNSRETRTQSPESFCYGLWRDFIVEIWKKNLPIIWLDVSPEFVEIANLESARIPLGNLWRFYLGICGDLINLETSTQNLATFLPRIPMTESSSEFVEITLNLERFLLRICRDFSPVRIRRVPSPKFEQIFTFGIWLDLLQNFVEIPLWSHH